MQFLGTQKQATPRIWHNVVPLIPWNPSSLEYARTWCPKWIRWDHWGCRRRQQRLLLSLASSLLASLAGKDYTNFKRVRARTPRKSHGCYTSVLLLRTSPLPFIATRKLAEGEPVNHQYTFHERIHGSIHGCSQSCNNADSPNSNVSCEHWIKSRTSRFYSWNYFGCNQCGGSNCIIFLGFYPKKRSFRIPDLMNPANNLKDKIWCHDLNP